MGKSGVIPKRRDQLRRTNKEAYQGLEKLDATDQGKVYQPEASDRGHPLAKDLWRAMGDSAQSIFYEPSDWALAAVLMDDLSHYLRSKSRPGIKLSAIINALTPLLLTEGERRRVRLEIERGNDEPGHDDPTVAIMANYRKLAE